MAPARIGRVETGQGMNYESGQRSVTAGPVPTGMIAIPDGTFRMGSDGREILDGSWTFPAAQPRS